MNRTSRTFARFARLAGALLLSSTALQAQGPSKIVSINPFLPLAGYFQGEFEARVRDNLAVAVSGAHMRLDDLYSSVDVKLRFYPSGRALQGFGLSMGLGYGRVENDDLSYDCLAFPPGESGGCADPRGESTTGPTASVEAQYQWLLGKSRNTAVTFGAGAKRYYIDDNGLYGSDLYQEFVPTLRLTIGYAFR